MSVKGVGRFLASILPAFVQLASNLLRAKVGAPEKPRKGVQSRTEKLKRGRAENDAAARKRFGR